MDLYTNLSGFATGESVGMWTYRIDGVTLALDEAEQNPERHLASRLNIAAADLVSCRVLRRSLDARKNRPPCFVYSLEVTTATPLPDGAGKEGGLVLRSAPESVASAPQVGARRPALRPVVVGCGPAGLFAALVLARNGCPPLLLERGQPVDRRASDVERFWAEGRLDPESSVQFGEGGAGTFSDGKLTTRVKNPAAPWVRQILFEMGAPASVLIDAKPHIGTDRLRTLAARFRQRLIALGCEIRFGARVTDLVMSGGGLQGVVVNDAEEIPAEVVLLAAGQSGDDTYAMLSRRGVSLEAKPFAMGLRVEHPQDLINRIQYGRWADNPELPPAEYILTAEAKTAGRSVYTFCMCPGGEIVGSSAVPETVVTNGMSGSRRDGRFANAAVVVPVRPEDYLDPHHPSALDGLAFRAVWEAKAYYAAGGDYRAPASYLADFLAGKTAPDAGETTFRPGVVPVPLETVLPGFVAAALREGLRLFDGKMRGFCGAEAMLVGVETRTSSPVRIVRGKDGQSVTVAGLYPCGEGAGYAGGIVSSALDGIRSAQRILGVDPGEG